MAITTAERTAIIELTVMMFNAAPGATYLSQIVALYEANPGTSAQKLQTLANQLSQTSAYTSLHPNFETAEEFAADFLTPLGLQNDAVARDFVIAKFNAGVSKGQIMYEGYVALKGVPSTANNQYTTASAILENKTEVAEYYSVTKSGAATDLASLQATVANVTAADSSVTAAKAAIDGTAAGGQTFTLAAGVDNIVGTAGDDVINAFTVNSSGAATETFSTFDNIDGAAGTDTLNIYTTGTENEAFPGSSSVKNVEIINIFNTAAAAAYGDASKFVGATQLWQHNTATDVTNLAATTVAGFKDVEATVAADLVVTAATTATTVSVSLNGVKGAAATAGAETINRADLDIDGAALTGVTVAGTLAQKTTTAGSAAASLALNVTVAKDAQAATVNSAVRTILTIDNAAGSTKNLTSVDASASTGAITYTSGDTDVATIKTGSGNDTVKISTTTAKDDAVTTTVDETVSAAVDTGAGNDTIEVATTGAGLTTVNSGDGNDTVNLTTDAGTGKLTVFLGAGNDTFKGTGAVAGTDSIDGGDGTDSLLLKMIGSANIGAFSNFEVFDAAGLGKTLDVDILATKNTVTEFVASADVGVGATLTNVGAGVGYRVTGDTDVANALTLTQKTAGALTVTLDIDEPATTAANNDSGAKTNVDAAVVATNATSIKAVFDSSFKDAAVDTIDNLTNLTVTGTKATALEIVSGGTFAINDLVYNSGVSSTAGKDLLATVTISGDRALTLAITETGAGASQVTAINASALTAALTISTAELKAESAANKFDGGVLTLGSGADVVTITQGAAISGIAKGSAEGATAQGAFDVLSTGGAVAQGADDVSSTDPVSVKDGKLTFNGAGPATLADAIALVDTQIAVDGQAVVFEYIGNSYVFVGNDAGTDIVVKLAGVTGLAGLDEVGATNLLYVF